jgi:hypothetical protein
MNIIEVHGFCVLQLPFQVDNSGCSFMNSQVKLRARNQTMFGFAFEISQIMVSRRMFVFYSLSKPWFGIQNVRPNTFVVLYPA